MAASELKLIHYGDMLSTDMPEVIPAKRNTATMSILSICQGPLAESGSSQGQATSGCAAGTNSRYYVAVQDLNED